MEILITEQDHNKFKKYYELFETAKNSGFVRNYTTEAYNDMLGMYIKYVNHTHTFAHWCGDCRLQLVMQLYNWYEKNNKSEKSEKGEISEEQIKTVVVTDDESKQVKKKRGRKPKNN